ncbi:type III secretion system chaperone [Ramlibacter sp. AW1]|uniref:Type III secretion system chaperone n=1 Tax=Ramlibacter aurantiacus TaxID=2801330 RepID=A0A937D3Z9_9BURK|nr:type III secretion system chaperone [Ramlibacter aurantiacus]MBL0423244.1 type III secretion system chaperone [Ramlibacter aurantiacus]
MITFHDLIGQLGKELGLAVPRWDAAGTGAMLDVGGVRVHLQVRPAVGLVSAAAEMASLDEWEPDLLGGLLQANLRPAELGGACFARRGRLAVLVRSFHLAQASPPPAQLLQELVVQCLGWRGRLAARHQPITG